MKHPPVRDLGLRNGVDGCLSPSDYHAAVDAIEDATRRVLEVQARVIRELRDEIARLRAGR